MSLADEVEDWMINALRVIRQDNEGKIGLADESLLDRIRQLEKDAELGALVRRMPELLKGLKSLDDNGDIVEWNYVGIGYGKIGGWYIGRWYDGEPEAPLGESDDDPIEAFDQAFQMLGRRIRIRQEYERECAEADAEDEQKALCQNDTREAGK